eukprot:jgi/Tetstr1/465562/TSEL_000123.t2
MHSASMMSPDLSKPPGSAVMPATHRTAAKLWAHRQRRAGNGSQRPFNHGFATADWALVDNRSAVYHRWGVPQR